jgi:hypothetical protein
MTPDRSRVGLFALLLALCFAVGAVYKWVDEQGNVHYSDTPPPGRESQVVPIAPGPTAAQRVQAERQAAEGAQSAQREAAERSAAQAAQQSARQAQATAAAGAELAVQVCADAMVQRMTLDLQTPVYRRSHSGEFIYLADADRPAEKKRLDDVVARYCSNEPAAKSSQRQRFLELSLGRRANCVDLRDELEMRKARPNGDEAEQIQRLTERLETYHCYLVPVDQVWLAKKDYILKAPPGD